MHVNRAGILHGSATGARTADVWLGDEVWPGGEEKQEEGSVAGVDPIMVVTVLKLLFGRLSLGRSSENSPAEV